MVLLSSLFTDNKQHGILELSIKYYVKVNTVTFIFPWRKTSKDKKRLFHFQQNV